MTKSKNHKTIASFDKALENAPHLTSLSSWQRQTGVARTKFWDSYYGYSAPNIVSAMRIARAAGTTVENLFGHLVTERKSKDE